MPRIQGLQGMQYSREGTGPEQKDYAFFNQQYAISTHQKDHNMYPNLIVQPKGDEDVVKTVNWAREHKVAVAVKSGGHQYSGASSTSGQNIQLDLTNTYKDMMVINPVDNTDKTKTFVYVGVSNQLKDFNAYLRHNELFVPHGQCAYVCVGGHGQTGGYGQLGRSFGLFGDHIRTIRMVCHDGVIRDITKQNDPKLFYAILGGSPGNFGIITHYIVEVHQAKDYLGSPVKGFDYGGPRGIKGLWIYSPKVLTRLLEAVASMAADPDFPRGFDICVSVLSTDFPITQLFPELSNADLWDRVQEKIKKFLADEFFNWLEGSFPASIILYAQWCPTSKDDKYNKDMDAWFQQFRDMFKIGDAALQMSEFKEDMSKMTGEWIFPKQREFDLPYVKRAYSTNSRTLLDDDWVKTAVERIDLIYNEKHYIDENEGDKGYDRFVSLKLAVQIQCFGGNQSRFSTNRDNGTSYSWRDTTVVQVLDCFHKPDAKSKQLADEWQAKNDKIMNGPQSPFSKTDRRLLWGSYGDWDLGREDVWKYYYESKEKYQTLGAARATADPNGTFTPNPFAVTRLA